jgi:hypothetical protein
MNYDFEEAFPHNGKASVPDPKIIFFLDSSPRQATPTGDLWSGVMFYLGFTRFNKFVGKFSVS